MTGAATRHRWFDRAAIAALAIGLVCASGAGASARGALPGQIWGVEATGASAPKVAASVRGSRVNALVIDAGRATPKQLRAAKRIAARGKLALVASAARAGSTARSARAATAACSKLRRAVAGVHCAVTARRIGDVRTLVARPGVKLVVVRLQGPGQLTALRNLKGSARVLALVRLGAGTFRAATWRSAIASARLDDRVDLAIAPATATGTRSYTKLLGERQALSEEPSEDTPGAPRELRVVEAAAVSITLAWSPAPGPAAREYRVYANGADAGVSSVLSMTVTGLVCGRAYRLEVEAIGENGEASPRASVNAATASCAGGGGGGGGTPADTQAPSAPGNLRKTAGTTTSVTMSWTASTDNIAVTGYLLYVDGAAAGSSASTSHAFAGLVCGRTYSFGVSARDAAGNVSTRSTASAATSACAGGGAPDTVAPSVPSGLVKSSSTTSSISVSWTASSDNVGVAGYGLYRGASSTGSTANRSATFSGLACGTSYSLAVDAYDAAGNRSAKATITAATNAWPPPTPPPPPPPPGGSASVFIAPNGSDSNACSQTAPCKTFDRGFRAAAPGAVVEMAAGLYPGQQIIPNAAKAGSTPVQFRPAPGANVELESLDVFGDHVDIGGITIERDFYVKCGADDVTFRNSKASLFFIRAATNIQIIDTEFGPSSDISQIGHTAECQTSPDQILMDRVYMHDYVNSATHMECLTVQAANNLTIRNSRFTRCQDFDIFFKHRSPVLASTNITLENNWFDVPWPTGSSSISFSLPDGGGSFSNLLIRNNSFAGGLLMKPDADFRNARVIANVGISFDGPCGDVTTAYNVWSEDAGCSPTDRQAPTGYVNQSGFDFHLRPGAAAIDRGDPTSYPATDIDGQARPRGSAPDAGADETG